MNLVPARYSQLTYLLLVIFPLPSYLPNCTFKCHQDSLVVSHFPFVSSSVFFHFFFSTLSISLLSTLSSFFIWYLFSGLPHCPCLFHLSHYSIMRKTISPSPGNRLTFAAGYCSHLLALKYQHIQNPTLHLRQSNINGWDLLFEP